MKRKIKIIGGIIIFGLIISGCTYPLMQDESSKDNVSSEKIEEKISPEEAEFNQSGRAKAIVDETDLWQFFEDELAQFSLKYPHSTSLSGDGLYELKIDVESIENLVGTMGFNKETALKNKESLSQGEYGEEVDWPIAASKKVRSFGSVNAQEFMVLSRFEVCDVRMERHLYFFRGNYQVHISLTAPKNQIIKAEPQFFQVDRINCGEEFVWNFERQEEFYKKLEAGKGALEAQEWFDTFDGIVGTIEFFGLKENPFAVEQIDKTNWKTYYNDYFNFDMKYPDDWTIKENVLNKDSEEELINRRGDKFWVITFNSHIIVHDKPYSVYLFINKEQYHREEDYPDFYKGNTQFYTNNSSREWYLKYESSYYKIEKVSEIGEGPGYIPLITREENKRISNIFNNMIQSINFISHRSESE